MKTIVPLFLTASLFGCGGADSDASLEARMTFLIRRVGTQLLSLRVKLKNELSSSQDICRNMPIKKK